MPDLTILRTYAQNLPQSLPDSILFRHSSKNITIFDAFPKSIFHFLVIPRVQEHLDAASLSSLQSLLKGDKKQAKEVITALAEEAMAVKKDIQDEMVQRYGFKWDVWIGFHGAPSMTHLHLHVLSADLCSEKLKTKKHYNSFHPKLGFFLHIDEVLSWFDAEPSYFASLVKDYKSTKYEPILKEDLACFHCDTNLKNMPTLKTHLQEEWNKLERRAQECAKRKRKLEQIKSQAPLDAEKLPDANQGPAPKKAKSIQNKTSTMQGT